MIKIISQAYVECQGRKSSTTAVAVKRTKFLGAGNNPMVGMTVAVAVAVEEASK